VLCTNKVAESRLLGLSLALSDLSLCLRLLLQLLVELDSIQKLLTTARVLHMLHSNVYPLSKNTLPDALVDNDTECMLGNVVYDTCTTVIALVWHTFLHCTITAYINNVSLLVRFHIGRQWDDALGAKLA